MSCTSIIEWFKAVEHMKIDPRYPIFSFACPAGEAEKLEEYIKERYGFYRFSKGTFKGNKEVWVDLSTIKAKEDKK